MAPLHDRLSGITAPVLVLAGELDQTSLERARFVADGMPHARLEIIEAAGHTPHLEQPDTFLRLTNNHLSTTPVSQPH